MQIANRRCRFRPFLLLTKKKEPFGENIMKKNTALYILAVIICLFLAAFVFHVPALRHLFHNLYGILQSPYILVSAAVCAFLFINTKNYWLIIAGCGIAAALIIQFAVIGHGAGLYTIAVRALAFVTVVYLLNLVKVIFAK